MKRTFLIIAIICLAIAAQAQLELKKGLKVGSKTITNSEIEPLDSIKPEMPIQRQLDKKVNTSGILDYTHTIYTKTEVDNLLKYSARRLETVTNARIDHTGTTNETTLVSITVPADRLNKNAVIKFWIVANFTNSATNKVVRLKDQSGAQVWSSGNVTTSSSIQVVPFVALRNSLTSQVYPNNTYFGSNQTSVVGTSTFDAANGLNYTLTAQCAQSASDHIYIESFWVETIKGAE